MTTAQRDRPNVDGPIVSDGIFDAFKRRFLKFTPAATAVNYLDVRSGATGTSPALAALGADANLHVNLVPQGIGRVQEAGVAIMPTGAVLDFAGDEASVPAGWLLCTGQAVSRTTYARLFAVISTRWGVGDGATTFNVPDLRGRSRMAPDNMGGAAANVSPGVADLTLGGDDQIVTSGMPSHTHAVDPPSTSSAGANASHTHSTDPAPVTTTTEGAHTHSIDPPDTASATESNGHVHSVDPANTTSTIQSANHTHGVDPAVASTSVQSPGHTHGTSALAIANESSHTHNVYTAIATNLQVGGATSVITPTAGISGEGSAHTHTISGSTDAEATNHTHTVDIPVTTSATESGNHAHDVNIAAFNSADVSATHTHTLNIGAFASAAGTSHDHSVDVPATTSGIESADHTHAVDIGSFASGATGGGGANGNLHPIAGMNAIIKT